MARLKKRYWFSFIFMLIISLLGLFGWHYWLSFKQKNQLTLDWHGFNIGFDGVSFDTFTVSQQSQLSLTAKKLHVSWSNLSAENVDIYWQPVNAKAENISDHGVDGESDHLNPSEFDTSSFSSILYWLPKAIHIHSLRFYQNKVPLFDIKLDMDKQPQAIQLELSTNTQYAAKLSTVLQFNEADSRIDIQHGMFTTSLAQFGIQNGDLSLPFKGSITQKQLTLTNLDNASFSLKKANVSEDFIVNDLSGNVRFQIQSPLPFQLDQTSATGQLTISQFNGLYKNSEIKSATGNINLSVNNNNFTLFTSDLYIQEINLGIGFEKVNVAGAYSSTLTAPTSGVITWKKLQARLFSGQLSVDKGKLNLSRLPQQINVRLKQIQLKDILAKYPVEGLAGNGTIDGILPITLSEVKNKNELSYKLVVKNGQLVSTNQGELQFENSALKDYVKNNPNMKILTDILKNFHYTKLSSKVDYANDIAKLGLTIQGNNLDVQNGKAVNLNITLEENIAKLMTSLLLSDQISEPIRKRIEARLKKNHDK
ncbi:intermembrane phospholipid transport protein YdbH family protein [Gilliamella sp. wkB308]|uniref:intermembrane phospholipid transport protein YdbH family protein n=1 Tax=Gilliamella sp. wkB308 TaxID=3120263 RepID=UPI00080DEED9|nr:YdbH domain-containing protein [Gilliamella apicola]OCF96907.1 hypothetical protein A9G10_00520 [Gilliamella apicola]